MRLHWFREHKQIVYWILCPAIVLSMSIFGVAQFKGSLLAVPGPSVTYTVGSKEASLSPSEVLSRRITLYKFVNFYVPKNNQREDNPTTDNIGLFAAENETARQRGFEIGVDELKEFLRNAVKYKVSQIDNNSSGKDIVVTKELYGKLLEQMDMSASQFEQLIHDLALREKFHQTLQDSIDVPDQEMFIKYSEEKENVRIRFKVLKSDDFVKDTKAPTDAEIKAFFETKVDKATGMQHKDKFKDIYMSPATLSMEALAYKDDKIFSDIKAPTDAELKATYDNYKSIFWKDTTDPKKTDAYKPIETVKADVEKHWRDDKVQALKRTVEDNVTKALKELTDAESAAKDPKAKDPKPVDVAAFAAAHKMTRWETPEQAEEKYSPGKLEVNAPDLSLGTELFRWTKKSGPQDDLMLANQMKHLYEFTPFRWIDPSKPELGGIVARTKKFNPEVAKTLDQAKEKIIEQLKIIESATLAQKAAEKLQIEWKRGENLPKLEDLDEVVSDKKESHPLVRNFRNAPKALGEVLDVASDRPESEKFDVKDFDKKWFFVGCAVERKLPSLASYASVPDTEWSRETAKHGTVQYGQRTSAGIVDDNYKSELGLMVEQIKSNVIHVGNKESEPNVKTSYNDSRNSDY